MIEAAGAGAGAGAEAQDHINGIVDLTRNMSTFFCRALYDYQSNVPSSLSFHEGDVIEVLVLLARDSDWWEGVLEDERGWFLSHYVTRISKEEARDEARAAKRLAIEEERELPILGFSGIAAEAAVEGTEKLPVVKPPIDQFNTANRSGWPPRARPDTDSSLAQEGFTPIVLPPLHALEATEDFRATVASRAAHRNFRLLPSLWSVLGDRMGFGAAPQAPSQEVHLVRLPGPSLSSVLEATEDLRMGGGLNGLPGNIKPTDTTEPFSKDSILCRDGQISEQSKYMVACGGYADVWTGSLGGNTVAIKIMRPFSSLGTPIEATKLVKRLWREYLAWSTLSHPNILQCLGFSYDFTPQSDHQVPSLISPWMTNGTVLFHITAHPDVDRLSIVVGIAQGLTYLHNRNPAIVHGDIRAGNVLVSDAGTPCLTDFGLSKIISQTQGMTTSSEVAGSLRWMAPELFHGEGLRIESDVWAFGMSILEIFTGKRPFSGMTLDVQVLHQIIGGKCPVRPTTADAPSLTDKIWSICEACWYTQPTDRPRISGVLAALQTAY